MQQIMDQFANASLVRSGFWLACAAAIGMTLSAHTAFASATPESRASYFKLENGMEVEVPQFIKAGDSVKIAVESGKYLERVK